MISGFHHNVSGISALLGVTQRRLVVSYRRFGTTSPIHHQGCQVQSSNTSLNTERTGCTETSVAYSQYTLRNKQNIENLQIYLVEIQNMYFLGVDSKSQAYGRSVCLSSNKVILLCTVTHHTASSPLLSLTSPVTNGLIIFWTSVVFHVLARISYIFFFFVQPWWVLLEPDAHREYGEKYFSESTNSTATTTAQSASSPTSASTSPSTTISTTTQIVQ